MCTYIIIIIVKPKTSARLLILLYRALCWRCWESTRLCVMTKDCTRSVCRQENEKNIAFTRTWKPEKKYANIVKFFSIVITYSAFFFRFLVHRQHIRRTVAGWRSSSRHFWRRAHSKRIVRVYLLKELKMKHVDDFCFIIQISKGIPDCHVSRISSVLWRSQVLQHAFWRVGM